MRKKYNAPELDYIIYHTPDIMSLFSFFLGASGDSIGAEQGTDNNPF